MSNLSAILGGITRLRIGTTGVPVVYPALAAGVAPTAGAAWVQGAWSQVVAAGSIGAVSLIGVVLFQGVDSDSFQWEVGEGGAGSEIVVARGANRIQNRSDAGLLLSHQFKISPAAQLTTDARLAVRIASGGGGTATTSFYLIVAPRPF